jgi:hypothetical protein
MFVPHWKHITSPLPTQQVNAIYGFVTMVHYYNHQFWTLSIVLSFSFKTTFLRLNSVSGKRYYSPIYCAQMSRTHLMAVTEPSLRKAVLNKETRKWIMSRTVKVIPMM